MTITTIPDIPVALLLPPIDPFEFYATLCAIGFLVIIGGLGAGLTIGLMSLDQTNLEILKQSGTPVQKRYAARIEPVLRDTHVLLVSLLLLNTLVNESLPVLFNRVRLDGYSAVFASTLLVVVFGEIIPQAVCSRYGLAIGAFFAWPVRVLMFFIYPVVWPIAKVFLGFYGLFGKLLDLVLGQHKGLVYRRAELKELVHLHGEGFAGMLTRDEVQIVQAVLDLRDKNVGNVMTALEHVVMLPLSVKLDRPTISAILRAGHSRIPVYADDRQNIIGVLLVKQLILLDPHDAAPLHLIKIRELPRIKADTPLFDILHEFQTGGSHMAVVVEEIIDIVPFNGGDDALPTTQQLHTQKARSPLTGLADPRSRPYKVLGIVTLEDVIEEMIGQEIIDETDVYIDVTARTRVASAVRLSPKRTSSYSAGEGGGASERDLLLGNPATYTGDEQHSRTVQPHVYGTGKSSTPIRIDDVAPPKLAKRRTELFAAGILANAVGKHQHPPYYIAAQGLSEDKD